jgi:hypothetical protein
MATYNKFQDFVEQLGLGIHDLNADLIKVGLTNTAPVATNTIWGNITEITAENGYTAGGEDTTNTYSETTGTGTVSVVDVTWTATGGTIGPFQYVVAYNDTPSSPVDPLIGWWNRGSALTLQDTESFTVDFENDQLLTIA